MPRKSVLVSSFNSAAVVLALLRWKGLLSGGLVPTHSSTLILRPEVVAELGRGLDGLPLELVKQTGTRGISCLSGDWRSEPVHCLRQSSALGCFEPVAALTRGENSWGQCLPCSSLRQDSGDSREKEEPVPTLGSPSVLVEGPPSLYPTLGLAIFCPLLLNVSQTSLPKVSSQDKPATSRAFQVLLHWHGRHLRTSPEELGPSTAAMSP